MVKLFKLSRNLLAVSLGLIISVWLFFYFLEARKIKNHPILSQIHSQTSNWDEKVPVKFEDVSQNLNRLEIELYMLEQEFTDPLVVFDFYRSSESFFKTNAEKKESRHSIFTRKISRHFCDVEYQILLTYDSYNKLIESSGSMHERGCFRG